VVPGRIDAGTQALAENHSVPTPCAEHDNVNVPFISPGPAETIVSFRIEARHPGYVFEQDHGEEDFTNCPPPTHQDTFFPDPGAFSIHDDGITAIVAIRLDRWWRPRGMTAIGSRGEVRDAHFLAVHRKVADGHYPQVLVFYSDGNLRLKPLPPPDRLDTLFGSSVLVGPAPLSDRPFVTVRSVEYRATSDSLEIIYEDEEAASLYLEDATRESTRVRVEAHYATRRTHPDVAFATFRSMYVAERNADVDHVVWKDGAGQVRDAPIMAFAEGLGGEFLFKRDLMSRHNTSAPDIWIGDFEFAAGAPEFVRGDADGTGELDVTDAIHLLDFLFLGRDAPPCADAADADDSGILDLTDGIFILHFLFLGGPPPPPPFAGCGRDRTGDLLGCAAGPRSC
jgi:hypothetical protein